MEWVPIKDDWCEVKIFQYIAVEVENKATYCLSVEEVDIFLRGAKNYEVHHSKSI